MNDDLRSLMSLRITFNVERDGNLSYPLRFARPPILGGQLCRSFYCV